MLAMALIPSRVSNIRVTRFNILQLIVVEGDEGKGRPLRSIGRESQRGLKSCLSKTDNSTFNRDKISRSSHAFFPVCCHFSETLRVRQQFVDIFNMENEGNRKTDNAY